MGIQTLSVKNYGCIKDVEIQLGALHAFIGPNDSGKSTLLRAVRTIVQAATDKFTRGSAGKWEPFDPSLLTNCSIPTPSPQPDPVVENDTLAVISNPEMDDGTSLVAKVTSSIGYELLFTDKDVLEAIHEEGESHGGLRRRSLETFGMVTKATMQAANELRANLRGQRLARFEPDALRQASSLIPDDHVISLEGDKGNGLPGIYYAVVSRDFEAFQKLQEEVRRFFPSVDKIQLPAVSGNEIELRVKLKTGEEVRSAAMSEGLLFFLAYALLPLLRPVSVLLVEEPENGLHPARIAEIMRILREISKTTQVLIATHSPLVVNELQPDEVSVVTRDPVLGTQVKPIRQTPRFEERAKVYSLGELWLSYSDGDSEKALLGGRARPQGKPK